MNNEGSSIPAVMLMVALMVISSMTMIMCLNAGYVETEETNAATTEAIIVHEENEQPYIQDNLTTTSDKAEQVDDISFLKEDINKVEEVANDTDCAENEAAVYDIHYTEYDVIDIAKVISVECRGMSSDVERACVVWTILNRVDMWDSTVYFVVRQSNQYSFNDYTYPDEDMIRIARDVLDRWSMEKNGVKDAGRVLPKEYIYFEGDGYHNYFRATYYGYYDVWQYNLPSPYKD